MGTSAQGETMPIPAWSPPASGDQPKAPAPEAAAEAPAAPAWEQPPETPPAEPSPTDSAPTLVWQPSAAGESAPPAEAPAAPGWEKPATAAPAEAPGEAPAASPWEVPAASAAEPAAAEAPPAEPPAAEMPPLDRTVFVDSTQVGGAAEHDTAGLPTLVEAELVVASGPDSGHTYRLTGPSLRIGRAPDNDLVLRDPATSGHHARVERRGNTFFVVDLGSTNGTLVNGDVVQERELTDGDSITIGQNAVNFAIKK